MVTAVQGAAAERRTIIMQHRLPLHLKELHEDGRAGGTFHHRVRIVARPQNNRVNRDRLSGGDIEHLPKVAVSLKVADPVLIRFVREPRAENAV